jgi:hypothetical protein
MRPAIILDMDEMLLHTTDAAMKRNRIQSIPRPGVTAMLNTLEHLGDLYVLSAGTSDYIPEALRSIREITRFAGKHFSSRDNPPLARLLNLRQRRWVLVDDTPMSHSRTQHKLRLCGLRNSKAPETSHFVWIRGFEGSPSDRILPAVVPLVALALWLQPGPQQSGRIPK